MEMLQKKVMMMISRETMGLSLAVLFVVLGIVAACYSWAWPALALGWASGTYAGGLRAGSI